MNKPTNELLKYAIRLALRGVGMLLVYLSKNQK